MVWHRNSIGVLFQRFFFTLLMFSSIMVLSNCGDSVETSDDLRECLVHTGIPLVFVLFIVALKVSLSIILSDVNPTFLYISTNLRFLFLALKEFNKKLRSLFNLRISAALNFELMVNY